MQLSGHGMLNNSKKRTYCVKFTMYRLITGKKSLKIHVLLETKSKILIKKIFLQHTEQALSRCVTNSAVKSLKGLLVLPTATFSVIWALEESALMV